MRLPRLHHAFGIGEVLVARADRDALHRAGAVRCLGRVVVPHEARERLHHVGIVIRRHCAATGPALVADAEILHLVRCRMAICRALPARGGRGVGGHVFEPFGRLGHGAGAEIDGDIGVAADLVGEVHELVGSEAVWFGRAAQFELIVTRRSFAGPMPWRQ